MVNVVSFLALFFLQLRVERVCIVPGALLYFPMGIGITRFFFFQLGQNESKG